MSFTKSILLPELLSKLILLKNKLQFIFCNENIIKKNILNIIFI